MDLKPFIRLYSEKSKTAKVKFRLNIEGKRLYVTTDVSVDVNLWDNKRGHLKAKAVMSYEDRTSITSSIENWKSWIRSSILAMLDRNIELSSENLSEEINRLRYADKNSAKKNDSFFDLMDKWMDEVKVSPGRYRHYKALKNILRRYQAYKRISRPRFELTTKALNSDLLLEVETYILDEGEIAENMPELYEGRVFNPRSQNYASGQMRILRAFTHWLQLKKIITDNPFEEFSIKEEIYGTPIYISIEERNKLYNYDFSFNRAIETQRDVFVFQCLIGCRVSDLMALTKNSVINGAIEYIAGKTKDNLPITIRVPLNDTAQDILYKYRGYPGEKLLPFISATKYNKAIKQAFTIAKLDRTVIVLNPVTRLPEQKPLYQVVSSHTARKTFIGNLYNKVKDPDLIASMSGHVEGSKAFKRYRAIEEDVKKELVGMLE